MVGLWPVPDISLAPCGPQISALRTPAGRFFKGLADPMGKSPPTPENPPIFILLPLKVRYYCE